MKRKATVSISIRSIFWMLTLSLLSSQLYSQSRCVKIGQNVDFGASSFPFVDIYKSADRFTTTPDYSHPWWDSGLLKYIPADTNGYPLQLPYDPIGDIPDQGPVHVQQMFLTLVTKTVWPTQDISVLWDGDGDILFTINVRLKPANQVPGGQNPVIFYDANEKVKGGKAIINVDPYKDGGQYEAMLEITRSQLGNHLHNIRMLTDDILTTYKDKPFNQIFLDKLAPFYSIRFMDAFQTNNSTWVNWSDRTKKTNYSQSQPMAYEYGIEVCNMLKKHPWVNVPHKASDDFITKMATLWRDSLDPDLDIYVEYSNEIWNSSFSQWGWVYSIDPSEWGSNEIVRRNRNTFQIWRKVFGKDSLRVKRVIASQLEQQAWMNVWLSKLKPNEYDYIAPSWYFTDNGDVNASNTSAEIYTSMQNMLHSTLPGSFMSKLRSYTQLAQSFGKKLLYYEGGQGFTGGLGTHPIQVDPLMGKMYEEIIDSLDANPLSEMFNHFGLAGGQSQYGAWGSLQNIYETDAQAPKYAALKKKAYECPAAPAPPSDSAGSGLSLHLDGTNDYADITAAYKPTSFADDYTLEAWVKPSGGAFEKQIITFSSTQNDFYNSLKINTSGQANWFIGRPGSPVIDLRGFKLDQDKWYHIAAVKAGNEYRLFINGTDQASASYVSSAPFAFDKATLGALTTDAGTTGYFRGEMDEVRIWNTGINRISVLRDYMCKKVTAAHLDFTYMKAYFQFDDESGFSALNKVKPTQNAVLFNFTNPEKPSRTISSAPIGNESVNTYTSNWLGAGLSFSGSQGDVFSVSNVGNGLPEGAHIYMVKGKPSNTSVPKNYTSIGSDHYFGVFMANGNDPSYDVIYNYKGNPDASGAETSLRLVKRTDNSDFNWGNSGAQVDQIGHSLPLLCKEHYRAEYIIGIRPNLSGHRPGSGKALKANWGGAQLNPYSLDGDFTISAWCKGTGGIFHISNTVNYDNMHMGMLLRAGPYASLYSRTDLNDQNYNAPYFSNDPPGYNIIDTAEWYHATLVRVGKIVTLYANGYEAGVMSLPGTNIIFNKIEISYGFDGLLDEFTVWNKGLTPQEIRDWMCKKINKTHPYYCKNLKSYFQFEEGGGNVLEDHFGRYDMTLFGAAAFATSGAPVGNFSANKYTSQASVTLAHPDGDSLNMKVTTASWDNGIDRIHGAHVYLVDEAPEGATLTGSPVLSYDTTRYWGTFVVKNITDWGYFIYPTYLNSFNYYYDITYNYNKNSSVYIPLESSLVMLNRANNSGLAWVNSTVTTLNTSAKTLYIKDRKGLIQHRDEFLLAGTDANSFIINNLPPAQPISITGLVQVCAGQKGIVYKVVPSVKNVVYTWTMPNGFSGSSSVDSIIVNTANSSGGNISVTASNKYGASPPQTITVLVNNSIGLDKLLRTQPTCQGSVGKIIVATAQNGVSYQAFKNNVPSGTSVTGIGSDTTLLIPSSFLTDSVNLFTIQASQGACKGLILNNSIRLNAAPNTHLPVSGNTVCYGIDGAITLANSEANVYYTVMQGGSTISGPVLGNRGDLILTVPGSMLISGNNSFDIQASVQGCSSVILVQKGVINYNYINPNVIVSNYTPDVCLDSVFYVKVFKSELGVNYTVFTQNQDISTQDTGNGDTLSISVIDRSWTWFLKSGLNTLQVRAQKGSCSVVLNDTASVFVMNRDYPGYPYAVRQDFGLNHVKTTPVTVCQGDAGPLPDVMIENAMPGIKFKAFIGNVAVSDWVYTVEDNGYYQGNVPFHIDLSKFSPGINKVHVLAVACATSIVLNDTAIVNLSSNFSPDVNLSLTGGGVLCTNSTGIVVVHNAEPATTYSLYQQGFLVSTPVSNSNLLAQDITLTVPSSAFASGLSTLKIRAKNSNCPMVILKDSINISTGPKTDLNVVGGSICQGQDGNILINNSENNVSYEAFINGVSTGSPIISTGGDLPMIINKALLTTNTVQVNFKATYQSCPVVNLVDTASIVKIGVASNLTLTAAQFNVCPNNMVTLSLNTSDVSNVRWQQSVNKTAWSNAAGGTLDPLTGNYNPSTSSNGTRYYRVLADQGACKNLLSTIDSVNVGLPQPPMANSLYTYCQNQTASVLTATGFPLNWFATSIGGIGSNVSPTPNTALPGMTHYYVAQNFGSGCESSRTSIIVTVNPVFSPSVVLNASATSICSGTGINFTATGTNTGSATNFNFTKNGTTVQTGTSPFYEGNNLSNSDLINVILSTSGGCLSSSTITGTAFPITVNPIKTPTVTLNSNGSSICAGTGVIFTAVGSNIGTISGYSFTKNGSIIQSGLSPIYSGNNLNNNDLINVTISASGVCLSATTTIGIGITVTVSSLQMPTVALNSSNPVVCGGTSVTFTASGSNLGSNPIYSFTMNGNVVQSGSSLTYSSAGFINNDKIGVQLSVPGSCLTTPVLSNVIPITIKTDVTPKVRIMGSDSVICKGKGIVFIATGTNAVNPIYIFTKNGDVVQKGLSNQFISNQFNNLDRIAVTLTMAGSCVSMLSAVAPDITVTVSSPIALTMKGVTSFCGTTGTYITVSGANTYNWEPGALTGNINLLNPESTTNYTVTGSSGACSDKIAFTIKVNGPLASGTAIMTTPSAICEGNSAGMSIENGTNINSVIWQKRVNNVWINLNEPSRVNFNVDTLNETSYFHAKLSSPDGLCPEVYTNVLTVTVSQLPKPGSTDSTSYIFCDNFTGEVKLSNSFGAIQWQQMDETKKTFSDIQNNATAITPDLKMSFTNYGQVKYVRALVSTGDICPVTFTGTIKIQSCARYDFIPNALTPQSGDQNSVWDLSKMKLQDQAEVRIFNRYGTQVYFATGQQVKSTPWDGGNIPAGTYYYMIDRKDGLTNKQTGAVTVIK